MFYNGDMKGWQAVPIIIPSFLILSIATIWYFSFHHFKDRPRHLNLTSPMVSSTHHSVNSEAVIIGPSNGDQLVHLSNIPPLPKTAYSIERQHGSPAPSAALRAQRSKDSLQTFQHSYQSWERDRQGISERTMSVDDCNMKQSDRPRSYVVDLGTPPPIPAAHLHTPMTKRQASEQPIPLSPMNVITSSRKRKPPILLNHEMESTYSSPLSRFTASRSSVDEFDTTIVVEQSVAHSETPHIDTPELSAFSLRNHPTQANGVLEEPKKIFVVKNPNFIFPSVKREANPATPVDQRTDDVVEEVQDAASANTHRSNIDSITMSLRSFLNAHPSPPRHHNTTDRESLPPHHQPRPSISGPSLYTFEDRSPEWSITESDVYRNASPIWRPLIEHPDLENGFQRPKEWGKKTPDLIEAESISKEMRRIDRLRAERLGEGWGI